MLADRFPGLRLAAAWFVERGPEECGGHGGEVARSVLDSVAGFGPLQRWFDDPEVEEIWINQPGKVFVARHGRSELTTTTLAAGEVRDLVERMLRTSGRRV